MNKPTNKKTYISLFSSAGVGCYGFKMNNFECIATCELLEPRIKIQKYNNKCKYDSGYICGDMTKEDTKVKIFEQIDLWKEKENLEDVDVVVATPPCQGMSSANYKKNDEQKRNSLVVEAIKMIKEIKPKVFVFENVRAFIKTICTDVNGEDIPIGEAIKRNLSDDYNIDYRVINFKEYGVPSSRPRTLAIGTRKDQDYMSPLNLFPFPEKTITLEDAIGNLKKITEPEEYDEKDVYHFFRNYDSYMREWIHDLKEGESAFDNPPEKQPYKLVNGKKELLKSGHLGNKFRRLYWDKPAACVATRSDQLAAMDTIHPSEDRVLSIREIMRVMSIPDEFKWVAEDVNSNNVIRDRIEFLRQNELNIRRCIGEAVPTKIMYKISKNINDMLDFGAFLDKDSEKKTIVDNLYIKSYLNEKKNSANEARKKGTFYTPQSVIFDSLNEIKNYSKKEVRILEPSVGGGNFLLPIISKFYNCEKIIIDIVDVDETVLSDTLNQIAMYHLDPGKIIIKSYAIDFIEFEIKERYDFIIGNPPYFKLDGNQKKKYKNLIDFECDNIFGLFLEKIYEKSDNIIMILPKVFLMTSEFNSLRKKYEKYNIVSLIDYGVNAFKKVFIEIMSYYFTTENTEKIKVVNVRDNEINYIPQKYIYHDKMWLIYRNEFFDKYISKLKLDMYDFYRDRQITNKFLQEQGKVWVVKSKNILDDGKIIHIDNYDKYLDAPQQFAVSKYMNQNCILMPNFTYNIRATKMPKNVIVNGSVAILFTKDELDIDKIDLNIYATEEFRKYYAIVKNKSKFTINIDKNSIYYIGVINKDGCN